MKTTITRGQTKVHLENNDCIEAMRRLPAASIDLIVTSPPYNLGIKYSSYKDDSSRAGYLEWCVQWGTELKRLLKPTGSLFLNIGSAPSNPLLPFEITHAFTNDLFQLQNTIHWVKSISLKNDQGEVQSRGHFKPISSHRYLNDCHEYIFHLTLCGNTPIDRLAVGVPYADKSNINRWGHTEGKDKRCRGNIWFIPYKTIRDRSSERPHPATFPIELVENCILLQGNPSQLNVLDPFLGTGSSAIAAIRCKVKAFWGFEVDPSYLAYAQQQVTACSNDKSRSIIEGCDTRACLHWRPQAVFFVSC